MSLYEYLKKYNIKLRDFSEEHGIPKSTLYSMWKREAAPKYKHVLIITKATGGLVGWKE